VTPHHPYVEVISGLGGPRAVIKGTRIGVEVIVGYIDAGHSVHELAHEIFPSLMAAQIYDALSYYEDHRDEIDELIRENQPDVVRKRLYEELGAERAAKLLGEQRGAS
jgi:uncharacterized protein (DUF433 family)